MLSTIDISVEPLLTHFFDVKFKFLTVVTKSSKPPVPAKFTKKFTISHQYPPAHTY